MSGRTMRVAAIIVFATATGLAGCGGSGDSTSVPSGTAATQPGVTGDGDAATTGGSGMTAQASSSSAAFMAALKAMVTNDTGEPIAMNGFVAPRSDDTEALAAR